MKSIRFNTNSAQRVYDDYMQRSKKALKLLSQNDKDECLLEVNSHIYEYLEANKVNDELENLLDVLERLGAPEETFKELIASKKVTQAVRTLNPRDLFMALALNIRNGFLYIFLFILFLIFLCFPVLIVFKIIYPQNVGCYSGKNYFFAGYSNIPETRGEVLGNWFIPTMALSAVIIYFLIIFILKIVKK